MDNLHITVDIHHPLHGVDPQYVIARAYHHLLSTIVSQHTLATWDALVVLNRAYVKCEPTTAYEQTLRDSTAMDLYDW